MRCAETPDPETLEFDIREGDTDNRFFRRGDVAAHLLVTSGRAPRIIAAFPAGNAGAGVWFEAGPEPVALAVEGRLCAVERADGMRGISASITSDARSLSLSGSVLGSLRALRRFGHDPHPDAEASLDGSSLVLRRTTIDGAHHLELRIDPREGTSITIDAAGRVRIEAARGEPICATITALADDPPLTPIPIGELLADGAAADPRAIRALAFLAYEEKLLAGSWRFLTYFGRDTLLSVRLLLPVLRPAVIEAGLGSVIDRLGETGEVAHEEAIGEWAASTHAREGRYPASPREPIHDYAMVDDDFLLAPVATAYLLDSVAGRARAEVFLARRTPAGVTYAAALARNLELVARLAAPFAETPVASALIALGHGKSAGDWRDSDEGLGFGRVPFNVNVALVPAALEAAARLHLSAHFGEDHMASSRAAHLCERWRPAADLFRVEVSHAEAASRLTAYAISCGLDPEPALASIAASGALSFPALALDDAGRPIAVMHSDDGFVLLFTSPPAAYLDEAAHRILRPFPAGLRTPVGVVVANPALSPDPAHHALFTTAHYHGTVVWSWQQAMLAAGLEKQLDRDDLPLSTREALAAARIALWEVIRAAEDTQSSELWSYACEGGAFARVPFGLERARHHDESNAVQLWSTVYLAIRPSA